MAARAGVEPMTLRLRVIASTNAPQGGAFTILPGWPLISDAPRPVGLSQFRHNRAPDFL